MTRKTKKPVLRPGRLRRLARFLDKLPAEKFDFQVIVETSVDCGTVACAFGWCPKVFPKLVCWVKYAGRSLEVVPRSMQKVNAEARPSYEDTAAELFGMDVEEAMALFSPDVHLRWFSPLCRICDDGDEVYAAIPFTAKATAKNVAASIRAYVRWKQTGKTTDSKSALEAA